MKNEIRWILTAFALGLFAGFIVWNREPAHPPVMAGEPVASNAPAPPVEQNPAALRPDSANDRSAPAGDEAPHAANPGPSKLKVDPLDAIFENVPVNDSRTMDVSVANPTDKPITIKNLHASCGCTEPKMDVTVIQPGKTEKLSLTFHARPGVKKTAVNVMFNTDETDSPQVTVSVHATVKQEFALEPDSLQFDHIDKGAPKTMQAVVKRIDGKAFKIVKVTVQPQHTDMFAFKWEPIPDANGSAYTLSVTVTGTKAGQVFDTAILYTDDPKVQTVPFNLNVTIKSDVSCNPPVVAASLKEDGTVEPFETVLKRVTPGKLEVLEVLEAAQLPVEYTAKPQNDGSIALSIRLKDPFPKRAPFGQFTIKTNAEEELMHLVFRVNTVVAPRPFPPKTSAPAGSQQMKLSPAALAAIPPDLSPPPTAAEAAPAKAEAPKPLPPPPMIATPKDVTKLKLDPAEPDFGVVPSNEVRTMTVTITNPTDKPITIKDLRTSCSCTEAHLESMTIAAGKSEPMKLVYHAWPGSKKKEVMLSFSTDETGMPTFVLPVLSQVRAEFSVEPENLQFDKMGKGETKTAEVLIKRLDGKPFTIQKVDSSHKEIEFKLTPVEGSNGNAYKLAATMTGVKAMRLADNAIVVNDHPLISRLAVPIFVEVKADVTFTPAFVAAKQAADNVVPAFQTAAKRLTPGKLEILGVTEGSGLAVDFTPTVVDESSVKISIQFKEPFTRPLPFGQFFIKTNVEDDPLPLAYRVYLKPAAPAAAQGAPAAGH